MQIKKKRCHTQFPDPGLSAAGSRAVAQAVSRWLPNHGGPGSRPGRHVGFVVANAALGQVFSEYFGFPANHRSTNCSTVIITRGWHNRPIGGRNVEWTQLDSTPHYTN
jgi:hypothetical protein